MIDNFLIESARKIRQDFLSVDNKLTSYQTELTDISNSIISISKKLEVIKNQVGKKPIDILQKEIFSELNSLEIQARKIEELVVPLNNKMDQLRKDEENLWNKIKKKYPKVKEEDLISEIHKHIEK